jgi:hypothetical protein
MMGGEPKMHNQATFRLSQLRMAARLTMAALLSMRSLAQSPPPLTNLPSLSNPQGRIGAQANLRAIPPTSALARSFIASYRPRELNNGRAFYSRILINPAVHTYLGYELILEPQEQPRIYLLTFGKLGITPLDVAATYSRLLPQNPRAELFTMLPLPDLPEPQLVHEGQTVTIDLLTEPATGAKLIDDIHVVLMHSVYVPRVPTASGDARDFLASDGDFEIFEPQVSLNGKVQAATGPGSLHDVRSALPWFYFPNHGRFILSLTPHANLGFRRTGEVRGGRITFTLDNDSVKLESIRSIASGNGVYNIYVLHEPDWEPTSDRQKDYPLDGSIDVDEVPHPVRK